MIAKMFPGKNSAREVYTQRQLWHMRAYCVDWLNYEQHSSFSFPGGAPGRGGGACVVHTSTQDDILNATQHIPTAEQFAAGVIEPCSEVKERIVVLLTFNKIPSQTEVLDRARALAALVKEQGYNAAMIGGVAYLMPPFERELRRVGVIPLHAFTERRAVEKHTPEGVVKTNVFVHVGFFEGIE